MALVPIGMTEPSYMHSEGVPHPYTVSINVR